MYVGNASTLQLAEDILVEPDLAVMARAVYSSRDQRSFARPQAQDVLLVIEIALSSMNYDRKVKARLYARHGIREYWVIDALERVTWVHVGPAGDGWSSIVKREPGETLTTPAVPAFAIRLEQI
jgi:Uma2 family endonuclease